MSFPNGGADMKQLLLLSLVVLMVPALSHSTPYVSTEEYEKSLAIEENFELDYVPSSTSYSRGTKFATVDFPPPDGPAMATVSPAAISRLKFSNTGSSSL